MPAAHEAQLRCYRRVSGAQRVETAARLSEDVRAVTMAGIRARHQPVIGVNYFCDLQI
jgi:hypothetical protein